MNPVEPHVDIERASLPGNGHGLGCDEVVDLGGGGLGCEGAVEGLGPGPVPTATALVGSHDRGGVQDLSPHGPFDASNCAGLQRIKQARVEGNRGRHQM